MNSSTSNESFHGFDSDTAKISIVLNQQFSDIIFTNYANLLAKTSTPINNSLNKSRRSLKTSFIRKKMEHLFTNECVNSFDYDSGYTSLNALESNSSSLNSFNNGSMIPASFSGVGVSGTELNAFCLSEDALLEKPELSKNSNIFFYEREECSLNSINSLNSPLNEENSKNSVVLNGSVETDLTTYSGFNDSNVSNVTNVSVEIDKAPEIIYYETSSNFDNRDKATLQLNQIIENKLNSLSESNLRLSCPEVNNKNLLSHKIESDLENNMKIPSSSKSKSILTDLNRINTRNEKSLKYFTNKNFCEENKENINQIHCKSTPKKDFKNVINPDLSPELFDESDERSVENVFTIPDIAEEKYVNKKDQKLLKLIQNRLGGVLPPPSVTIVQISVEEILNKLESNKNYFWTSDLEKVNVSDTSLNSSISKSLLINSDNSNWTEKAFPEILHDRFHGLHYNRSKISEEFEQLCEKYGQRCVGSETLSTCTVFETVLNSPSKRKSIKRWNVKSPGRRLSHLARRRITFSNPSLQISGSSSANSRTRQILVDAQKLEILSRRKSPKKSSPLKSPRKTRTPTSSAKKKLALRFRKLTGEIETSTSQSMLNLSDNTLSTKRALFQSPEKNIKNSSLFLPSTSGLSGVETKRTPTKRALFTSPRKHSPRKLSPFKRNSPSKKLSPLINRKRKLPDDFLSVNQANNKLQRSVSEFHLDSSDAKLKQRTDIIRPQSALSGELSAIHKKKLQWAVYEALRSQNIGPDHNQFKLFASILARVTRKFMPNLTIGGCNLRPEGGGVSERMLRIARRHVYAVIKGKSVDEIVNEFMRSKMKQQKPQGYVAPPPPQLIQPNNISVSGNESSETNTRIDRIRKVINFGDQ